MAASGRNPELNGNELFSGLPRTSPVLQCEQGRRDMLDAGGASAGPT